MGDTVTFTPNTGINPTFDGRGSRIEHPDVLPIFKGPYWPGSGDMTVSTIMSALNSIASGPYLQGLAQYGFVGPVQVREPRVDSSPFLLTFAIPALAPGVDQTQALTDTVFGYLNYLVEHDMIDNVDDNHELIVLVFLDPSVPVPSIMDLAGKVTPVSGANTSIEHFEFADDNTRFEWAWITTSSNQLSSVTATLSHELVESITDPFDSGWHQTSPPAGPNAGQIGDVCNEVAIVDGVTVSAYWSRADGACVVTTAGTRRVSLTKTVTKHEPHDGPSQQGFVDLGSPLCAAGLFGYFERTFANELTIDAKIDGYESPHVDWTIDGQAVSILQGAVDVAASWDPEPPPSPGSPAPHKPALARLVTWKPSAAASQITIAVGPGEGNASFRVAVSVTESFDVASAGGKGSTRRTAIIDIDLENQEIVWDARHEAAKKNCDHLQHLAAGPASAIGPPRPGDPADLVGIVSAAMHDQTAQRGTALRNAAALLRTSRPDLYQALMSLAQRTG